MTKQLSIFDEPDPIPGPDELPPPLVKRKPKVPDFHLFLRRVSRQDAPGELLHNVWFHEWSPGRFLTLAATDFMVVGVWDDAPTSLDAKPLDMEMPRAKGALRMLTERPVGGYEAPLMPSQALSLRNWVGLPHWLHSCSWCKGQGVARCPDCEGRLVGCETCEMTGQIPCISCDATGWYSHGAERSRILLPPSFTSSVMVDRTFVAQVIETYAESDLWGLRPIYLSWTKVTPGDQKLVLIIEAGGASSPGLAWRAAIAGIKGADPKESVPTWPPVEAGK